jgi:hypothetical protein
MELLMHVWILIFLMEIENQPARQRNHLLLEIVGDPKLDQMQLVVLDSFPRQKE